MTFNNKIDIFMKDNNFENLKQLAEASGIPYTTLKDFYDKKSADNSRLSTIRKLSKFMGCSMDYLSYDEITNFNNNLENNSFNELEALFDKYRNLNEYDKKFVETYIEEKKKQMDKEKNNE